MAPHLSSLEFWRGVARLVRFDLRRFRMPMAIVAGLELLRAAVAEWSLHGVFGSGSPLAISAVFVEFRMMDGALLLATAIVTAMLVQADHPGDDRGFLRSRPIDSGTVALAKLMLLLGLVAILPFLITAGRLVAYGAPVASFAASAVQFVVIGGAVAVPGWVLALLTRTLPRFLAAGAGLVVAWTVTISAIRSSGVNAWLSDRMLISLQGNGGLTTFAPPLADWQHADARGWLFALGVTVAGAAILSWYYRTRRAVASAVAGTALVIIPGLLPTLQDTWPAGPDLVAAVDGRLRLPELRLPLPGPAGPIAQEQGVLVSGAILLPTLPPHISAERRLVRSQVTAPGLQLSAPARALFGTDAMRSRMLAAGATWPAAAVRDDYLFSLTRHQADAVRDRAVDYDALVDVRFTRHALVGEAPYDAGVAFRTGEYLFEIVSEDARAGWLLCRFTRFPSLSTQRTEVTPFVALPSGRVTPAMHGILQSLDLVRVIGVADEGLGWAYGRTWSRLVVLSRAGIEVGAAVRGARLRIVESRPAGSMRTRLVARDVPVRMRQPEPAPPISMSLSGRLE
jgi:hypothetical protein